ncbi:M20 family metallopeptidase [Cellulosimicrobium arenosum]|uniref:Peptidase M20 domain-containing protein 2 n=1 Tax=Cellulosimicrobium arenosum TaxID=2708133 RepID=A0A927PFE3_9MICO|nr:M20 family metallopeptidase [Cellulosimicrobium arenosum]MBD8079967.1 M20 family metallopeptidase [Cellulosimicrobium arenosum]
MPPPSTAYLDHVAAETEERRRAAVGPGGAAVDPGPAVATPEPLRDAVETAVAGLGPDLVRVVHTLHEHPETAFAEHDSARLLVDLVASHGIAVEAGAHGVPTAFRAELGTGDGPTIAICAEYDALPGIGHACGHNVIAAAGVGAFLALRDVLGGGLRGAGRPGSDGPVPGRVVLLGTPAEEGHSGKEVLARAGAFDDVDAAIMVHPYGVDVADQVWLGRRLLTWTFTGRAAHASAQPFMGRNALDAAHLAYQGIGLLRQQMPPSDRVHATIAEGGTRPSIITERAVMHLYARSKYADTLRDLSSRLDDVARGAALMTGTEVRIDWDDGAHPSLPVRTNQALTRRWVAAQRRRGRDVLPGGVVSETLAASTDFGNVSFRVPGIHPLIQVSAPDVALHTVEFARAAGGRAAEVAALDGAAGLAQTALDYLCDPELQDAVAREFTAQGGPVDVPRYFD